MKKYIVGVLCLAGLLATQVVTAQEGARSKAGAAFPTDFIPDDDGGVVQIVPLELTSPGARKANISPVMPSVRPVSVFLGRDWIERNARNRESSLSDLSGDTHLAQLAIHNVRILPASTSVEEFADLAGTVNDLTIQHELVEMLDRNLLPVPDADTIFVVFLAPGVKLTVGNQTAGIHFAAYHNLVHVEAGELRYVVVPFYENAGRQAVAASLAIANTAFNPASN